MSERKQKQHVSQEMKQVTVQKHRGKYRDKRKRIAPIQRGDQLPSIAQPPPSIEFAPWKEVPTDSEDTDEFSVSFPSAVVTPYRENNVVPLRIILPIRRDKPVPIVVVLHYWGATDLRVER